MSHAAGGFAESVPGLAWALNDLDVGVIGLSDDREPGDAVRWGRSCAAHRVYGPRRFGWAPSLSTTLERYAPDITDAQGLWMFPSLANHRYAQNFRRPYLITPRGMLDPWAVRRSRWRKRVAGQWFEQAHLRGAACLRALALDEARAIRAFGLRNPIAVVPNGVHLPPKSVLEDAGQRSAPRTLLFLGRLDPKKGVAELLQAWALVQSEAHHSGWRLKVTGWGDLDYVTRIKQHARELGLVAPDVCFTGPAYGEAKAEQLRLASAFILPSYSEGLPMAVLEAWSYGKPALLTQACNLPEGKIAGAMLPIDTRPKAIAAVLRELFAMTDMQLNNIGSAGRQLVEKRYTWSSVSMQMFELYKWVAGQGSPPSFVLLD